MSNYDSSPKGLEKLASVFHKGMDYFNTNFPSSPTLKKETFFFGGSAPNSRDSSLSEIAIQSMEDRFKNSNTFGEFSTRNTFGEDNFPLITSDFQPSKTNWQNLYNPEHTPKQDIGYHYSSNVGRDRLNIRFGGDNRINGSTAFSRVSNNPNVASSNAGEPYIVSSIAINQYIGGSVGGSVEGSDVQGRLLNFGGREFPIARAITDTHRITKFLSSPAGLAFIAKQEVLGVQSMIEHESANQLIKGRTFKAFYNPLSTLMSVGPISRFMGYGPNITVDRLFPNLLETLFEKSEYGMGAVKDRKNSQNKQGIWSVFSEGLTVTSDPVSSQIKNFFTSMIPGGALNTKANEGRRTLGAAFGDPHTLMPLEESGAPNGAAVLGALTKNLLTQELDKSFPNLADKIEGTESKTYGMPFYFKDLRDGKYIVFRAYLDGITENITPTWEPTNYVGRSEPVYVYSRGERDISFNLKLFAQTPAELRMIYQKMNRLTSLCYPQYVVDTELEIENKTRMKPPMTKFRLGELYGASKNEMTGFIKSLTYSIPDEGVWETEYGKRVPKYITVALNYQVIHATVPSLDFAENTGFYGYTGNQQVKGANSANLLKSTLKSKLRI